MAASLAACMYKAQDGLMTTWNNNFAASNTVLPKDRELTNNLSSCLGKSISCDFVNSADNHNTGMV